MTAMIKKQTHCGKKKINAQQETREAVSTPAPRCEKSYRARLVHRAMPSVSGHGYLRMKKNKCSFIHVHYCFKCPLGC